MKTTISAEIVADSTNQHGNRITTMKVTFPRFLLAELNTHRVFSRNSASSRAIPFKKMVEMVKTNPFIPIAWQKDHKGMQGTEYFTDGASIEGCKHAWLTARNEAVENADFLNQIGATKQLANRLLEPFMWHTVLVTSTEWENFFELRCPQYHSPVDTHFKHRSRKDCYKAHSNPENLKLMDSFTEVDWLKINEGQAEIHMMALAEAMWDAMNESTPKELQPGEWHIPYGDSLELDSTTDKSPLEQLAKDTFHTNMAYSEDMEKLALKIASARAARISYTAVGDEDKAPDYAKDAQLHDRLLEAGHMSPFEHCARAMNDDEFDNHAHTFESRLKDDTIHHSISYGWSRNFRGFVQYRSLID